MSDDDPLTLKFRCPKELEGLIPPPVPAPMGVPDWVKTMPATAFSALNQAEEQTVKRCPPFIDAMTTGFLIPLICDLKVEDGGISWDNELPPGGAIDFPRSPISFHDVAQVTGSPLFEADRFLLKFHNLWTIESPEGWALLFTHPVNRFDLPFTTATGLVDSDRFHDSFVHFPAHWHDTAFRGVIPRGTPVAQCIPVKRQAWTMQTSAFTEEEVAEIHEVRDALKRETGVYRKRFRA
ncbi:hypothetical protein S58_64030 [Bradyrhizobium oligotrophicum S58]|uniref:Uncharacterized protein n=1 Tax=Bradyrhizobium oligotrophicum S58 TaxID=1245469 RepID=M4ZFS3_9BRAD|nr:hypothetical protein [Bradyrhizobium oligotrophicum]BAM92376.1 hypothetical protein S58_64030 [Bradyrhizobium oligotrophicum S58]